MPNYHEYLQSPEWRTMSVNLKAAAGWRCESCGADGLLGNALHIHHRHYRTLGHEKPGDCVVLCGPCHATLHGIKGGNV